jgi:hypothetical protein
LQSSSRDELFDWSDAALLRDRFQVFNTDCIAPRKAGSGCGDDGALPLQKCMGASTPVKAVDWM